jgi:hypothetical protein
MLKKSGKPFANEYTYCLYDCRMCIFVDVLRQLVLTLWQYIKISFNTFIWYL